jgi:hypothetical protein
MGTGVLLSGVKQAELEANHASTSSADVKNGWRCNFIIALEEFMGTT